jgi:hypothetical protein
MLMAAATVNRLCAPTRLALKQAGLEYLLFDEAQARALWKNMQGTAGQSASPSVLACTAQTPVAAQTPQSPAGDKWAKNDVQTPPHERAGRMAEQSPISASKVALWPVDWQERLAKTRSAPVLWTYWELGRDLCGAPDPQRRELLQELLQELAHPPGTHSFWPVALPGRDGDGELKANAPVFWEGMRLLHSRALMIMGSQALRSLALPDSMLALRPFQQRRYQGSLLIVLPAPDVLIQEKQRMQALREFLRQALASFV